MRKLEFVRQTIALHLADIAGLFLPGAKVTVLVRRPGEPECDFLMTNDELPELEAMIARQSKETAHDER